MTRVATSSWAVAPQSALDGVDAAEQAAQLASALHLPGARDAHRALLITAKSALEAALGPLERAADDEAAAADVVADARAADAPHVRAEDEVAAGAVPTSHEVVTAGDGVTQPQPTWVSACSLMLLRVYCAFAEDARYGVGQLSRAAQRAPSEADCEDGWERVEEIARGAEDVARKALVVAGDPGLTATPRDAARARKLADRTCGAARAARATIESRNRAYTFHANPAFSFGEGWYAAAAAVLAGVELQIEPGQKHSAAAERFLVSAGLQAQLQPYRARPRANKALPLIVADVFRHDPAAAQARLRAAFLAEAGMADRVQQWLQARLPTIPCGASVLLWNRQCGHDAHRNSSSEELDALCRIAVGASLRPILIGDGLGAWPPPREALDLTLFWKEPLFQGVEMRSAQLALFEALRSNWALVGQVGVTTAGMDGPALLGLPTCYLTDRPNVRLGRWVGAVPNYEEVIRDASYLARLRARLVVWASSPIRRNASPVR